VRDRRDVDDSAVGEAAVLVGAVGGQGQPSAIGRERRGPVVRIGVVGEVGRSVRRGRGHVGYLRRGGLRIPLVQERPTVPGARRGLALGAGRGSAIPQVN